MNTQIITTQSKRQINKEAENANKLKKYKAAVIRVNYMLFMSSGSSRDTVKLVQNVLKNYGSACVTIDICRHEVNDNRAFQYISHSILHKENVLATNKYAITFLGMVYLIKRLTDPHPIDNDENVIKQIELIGSYCSKSELHEEAIVNVKKVVTELNQN